MKKKGKRLKKQDKIVGICPKCMTQRELVGHHVYPVRFYGDGNKNKSRLHICERCHKEIDSICAGSLKLSKAEYRQIHKSWLIDKITYSDFLNH